MGRKSKTGRSVDNSNAVPKRNKTRCSQANYSQCQQRNEAKIVHAENSTRQSEMMSEEDVGKEKSLLPSHICWIMFAWTVISRVWYVTTPANWWILHPDEIYQTVEVAHSEAFGYGFRPYEYLPPPGNETFSAEHAHTNRMGMYSLRSFLLVKVISMLILTAGRCGVTSSPVLVAKVFHAVVTSCLPLAVFRFSRALDKSRDIATLSAILTSVSLSLNLLGTHTLINSFISPLVFVSLVPLVQLLTKNAQEVCTPQTQPPDRCTIRSLHKWPPAGCCTNDENANIVRNSVDKVHSCDNDNFVQADSTGIHLNLEKLKGVTCRNFKYVGNIYTKFHHYALHGFLLGMCIYIRTDTILVPAVIGIALLGNILKIKLKSILEIFQYSLGIVLAFLAGGYVDKVSYGVWFISVKQWFTFNIWNGYSTELFGGCSRWFYMDKLLTIEPLAALGCFVFIIDVFITYVGNYRSKQPMRFPNRTVLNKKVTFAPLTIVCIYSLNGHKELRFVHDGIVLAYISLANSIFNIWKHIIGPLFTTNTKLYQYCTIAFYSNVGLLLVSNTYSFFHMDVSTISQWSYQGIVDADVNMCMDYLHAQSDVTGVFTDRSLYQTTGYSGLHQDVPLFVLIDDNFVEYDKDTRISRSPFFAHNVSTGFSMFNRMSDFISAHNLPYVAKILIYKKQYNYIVLGTDTRFLESGYEEVFRTQRVKIFKRTFDKGSEEKLLEIARRTPIGSNATVLEYEGNKLRQYGLYEKAEKRLKAAIDIDGSRIGPFQILMEMCLMFNNTENYDKTYKRCLNIHKQEECAAGYATIHTLST